MSPSIRDQIRAHPPGFLSAACEVEPAAARAGDARGEAEFGLRCSRCGAGGFRVLGVPGMMAGGARGFVLRSVLRVWRELRASASGDAGLVTRLSPPIAIDCARCGAVAELVPADAGAHGGGRPEPLEALRCRPCRRSSFAVAARFAHPDAELDAEARGGEEEHFDAWRLITRCLSCGMTNEPFTFRRRSEQQLRIDQLYGRSPGEARRR